MSGKQGILEEQTTKIATILKLSEQLTKTGISSTLIISHPVEGFMYSGAVMMTTRTVWLSIPVIQSGPAASQPEGNSLQPDSLQPTATTATWSSVITYIIITARQCVRDRNKQDY